MKGGFSFRLKSKFDVWERGHFDRRIKDRQGYEACIAYIHANPVKQRIVDDPKKYAYSSAYPGAAVDEMPDWLTALG